MKQSENTSDRNRISSPASTNGWQSLARAAAAGHELHVRLTCVESARLEGEIRQIVADLHGDLRSFAAEPGRSPGEAVYSIQLVPRSALTAGEILAVFSEYGSVAFQTVEVPAA